MSNLKMGKKRKLKRRRQKIRFATSIVLIVVCVALVILLLVARAHTSGKDATALEGLWIYDSVTSYEFGADDTGALIVSEEKYYFTYQVKGNNLHIDFMDDIVQDCTYKISIEDNYLTLEGKEGTMGGEYELEKKNIP